MEFKVLGPVQVSRDGTPVAVAGGKPLAVLAVLLLHANQPVSAERLAEALWGDEAPPGAVKTVQVHVSRLRRALGDAELVTTSRAGYRLRVQDGELDLDRFERLVKNGHYELANHRAGRARELLREALDLWRGRPLAELTFEPFAQAEIARLEEQRLVAVELRVEADLAVGRVAELVPELQRLVGEHPLRERLHGQLMLALYRSGRQADALAVYHKAREVLVEQLGIEPGEELRALERAVLAHDPALDSDDSELDAAGLVRAPLPPTRTVGREGAIADLRAAVGDSRLVTVVGAGGVGKTRVAIELARETGPALRDGAVFVSLAPVAASEHVASAIARELAVSPAPCEPLEKGLERELARLNLLLVLDNFEHVLDAAPLVADLLATAPDLTVVATSREPLRLRAERLFHLDPLPVVSGKRARDASPAVQLFAGAVQSRDAGFALHDGNLAAIEDVCQRLDGLPLAIELAAGRVGLMSVPALAARLGSGLDALVNGPRDAPARHRTLTATLEWSYALLDAREQRTFEALATFAGGCTLKAAEAVTGAPCEVLESLVAKNLAVADEALAGERRLRMLETIRAYARSRLERRGDADAVRRRHFEHYLALAERTRDELQRTASPALVAEIDRELDNLRAALAWALSSGPELALRLATATVVYSRLSRLRPAAADWLLSAFALPQEAVSDAVRAAALAEYSTSIARTSTIEEAEGAARESLRLHRELNDASGSAHSTAALAHVMLQARRLPDAFRHAGEAVRLADAAGEHGVRVAALSTMAMSAPTIREALDIGEQAGAMYRQVGNVRDLAGLHTSLVYTALVYGDDAAAQPLSLQALDAARAYDEPYVLALAYGNAALVALFSDRADAAQQAFASQLRIAMRYGLDSGYGPLWFEATDGLAAVAALQGDDRTAATLTGAAHAASNDRHDPAIARRLDERFFAPARARLGGESWQEAYAGGGALTPERAIELALRGVQPRVVA